MFTDIFSTDKKYQTIYADPPWPEHGGGKIKRGADRHYSLMTVKDIIALPVKEIAEDNSHLYLWATNNYIPAGLEVMKLWGFTYKTIITWGKDKFGLGQYFRGQTEHCLFGVRGNLPYKITDGKRQQGRTLLIAPRREHSQKPDEMREMIEKVSYGPYIELFSRQYFPNWDCWGDQAPKDNEPEAEEIPATMPAMREQITGQESIFEFMEECKNDKKKVRKAACVARNAAERGADKSANS